VEELPEAFVPIAGSLGTDGNDSPKPECRERIHRGRLSAHGVETRMDKNTHQPKKTGKKG
jgi:hypothetical protein